MLSTPVCLLVVLAQTFRTPPVFGATSTIKLLYPHEDRLQLKAEFRELKRNDFEIRGCRILEEVGSFDAFLENGDRPAEFRVTAFHQDRKIAEEVSMKLVYCCRDFLGDRARSALDALQDEEHREAWSKGVEPPKWRSIDSPLSRRVFVMQKGVAEKWPSVVPLERAMTIGAGAGLCAYIIGFLLFRIGKAMRVAAERQNPTGPIYTSLG
jgi:hypothetical protein